MIANNAWPYPWRKPISVYETNGPLGVEYLEFRFADIGFRVGRTGWTGGHTGRERFRVTCLDCIELLHPGTTSPPSYIEEHLKVAHGWKGHKA